MMNTADRLYKYDNAKAALIMLVVIGHFAEAYTGDSSFCRSIFMAIYIFHMPAFFFISGLFCRSRLHSWGQVWSRTAPFLLLCLVCNFIRFLSVFIYDREVSFHAFKVPNVSWYLFALFAFFILTYAVRNIRTEYVLIVSILVALIMGYDNTLGTSFAIYRITTFFPFFYLGSVCNLRKLDQISRRRGLQIAAAVFLIIFIVICYCFPAQVYQFRKLITGANSYYDLPFEVGLFSWVWRLVYCPVILLILGAFLCVIPSARLPLVSYIGTKTLSVYVLHLLVVETILQHESWLAWAMDSNLKILLAFIVLSFVIVLVFSARPFTVFVDFFAKPWKKESGS